MVGHTPLKHFFEENHIKSLEKTANGVQTCKVQRNPPGKSNALLTSSINTISLNINTISANINTISGVLNNVTNRIDVSSTNISINANYLNYNGLTVFKLQIAYTNNIAFQQFKK